MGFAIRQGAGAETEVSVGRSIPRSKGNRGTRPKSRVHLRVQRDELFSHNNDEKRGGLGLFH